MRKLQNIIRRLKKYNDNIDYYLEGATIEAEDTIVDMNISQLYDSGEDRDGNKITPEYAPITVAIKQSKGQPTNRVTLRDTFAFQSSIWVQYLKDGFEIRATDLKTEKLTQKYGDEILGLQDKSVEALIKNFYYPRLIKELRKNLGYE